MLCVHVADSMLCGENQYVLNHTCVSCPPGTVSNINSLFARHDANGVDTSCKPVLCESNHYVSNHSCVLCPSGMYREPGDMASLNNTDCIPTCPAGYFYCQRPNTEVD